MTAIKLRWIRALTAAALVAAVSVLVMPAARASAYPNDSWWYTYYNLAAVQKISTGAGVTVAVIDSGVQASLGDLRGQVLPGKNFAGDGSADARTDVPTAKGFGHGTLVAGLIAGTGKGAAGMLGVAPGAKILPAGVADGPEHIDINAAAKAVRWAADTGAKVINMSIGGPEPCSPEMQTSVDYAVRHDVIVVASAGNTPGITIGNPAACIGVIAVGALQNSSKQPAPWPGQTTGPKLDFVAPGADLRGLLLTDQLSGVGAKGTSDASAIASGVFALLRSKFPNESPRQIVTRAMYNVQNGAGVANFGRRINDRIGYGALLPKFALTDAPPAGAENPIYDAIEQHLAAAASSESAAASTASSTRSSGAAAADQGDDSGTSAAVIAVVVGLVVLIVVVAVVLARRSGRRPRGPMPPPSAGYPPPGG